MKNLPENVNNVRLPLTGKKNKRDLNIKGWLNNLALQLDAVSFFLIMLGGIIAIGKDFRAIGVIIVIAGFAGLFVHGKK